MKARPKPPWKKPSPKGARRPLTPEQKSAAKARAEKAGRRYPNLIDNMWAASKDASPLVRYSRKKTSGQ